MAHALADSGLRRVADVVDAGARAAPVQGRLAAPVLRALEALVPCDLVTFCDLEPGACTVHADDEAQDGVVTFLAAPVRDPHDLFWRYYPDARLCSYPTRTGDDRSVLLRSDFYGTAEWKRTPMYREVMREADVVFELLCPLPMAAGRSPRLVLTRSGSLDFTEEHRFALALLRPHLAELVARRRDPVHRSALTERQAELMRLVADGRTNAEIAATLHLSPYTVRAHLTNAFTRLGVTTRAAAVAKLLSG
ncbi:MAG: helix-turn-helix domain-containing protein [Mycobacteriales bacterium]